MTSRKRVAKNPEATASIKKFRVSASVTISVWTDVEAENEERAKGLAEERGMQSLCHQCGGARDYEAREEWRTSGELDGTPFDLTAEERE